MNKYINYIIVAYAFCVPLSRAGVVFFGGLLMLLGVISIIKDNIFRLSDIKAKYFNTYTFLVLFFSFLLLNIISLVWSSDIIGGMKIIKKYWYFLSIVIIFLSLKKEYMKYAISAFLSAMFISEIISYGIFFEFWTFKNITSEDPTPFMNHLQYSMFLAFTALLLLNRAYVENKLIYKYGYYLYFLVVTSNLFLNGGRTGQVAFIISIFLVAMLKKGNKLKAFVIILALISTIVFTAYTFSPNFKRVSTNAYNNVIKTFKNQNYCTSTGTRFAYWIVASDIIYHNPVLGVGVSDALTAKQEFVDKSHPNKQCIIQFPNFHNDFFQICVQLGLLGGFLYLSILYTVAKIKIKDNKYKHLPIIFISVYFISSQFETMFHEQFSMVLFTLFVGLLLAQNRIESDSH